MKALDRLETFLQDLMERPGSLLVSKRLHPLKLASALTKELEEKAVVLVDRVIVPDRYELHLSSEDWPQFAEICETLETELEGYIARHAQERELTLHHPPSVHLREDSALRHGEIKATATFTPGGQTNQRDVAGAWPVQRESPAGIRAANMAAPPSPLASPRLKPASLTLQDGEGMEISHFLLTKVSTTVGRRSTNDIALADTKVSRVHARIERVGTTYYITDLDSTNGVRINGREAPGRNQLSAGDVIEIGLQRLRFDS